jgi:hypothetical protein
LIAAPIGSGLLVEVVLGGRVAALPTHDQSWS